MIMNCRRIIVPFTRTIFSGAHFQSGSRMLSKLTNPLKEIKASPVHNSDILISDINPEAFEKIFNLTDIKNLSPTTFPEKPFPVSGIIFGANCRLMVALSCRFDTDPKNPVLTVWFIVDTGSPLMLIAEETLVKLMRLKYLDVIPQHVKITVQDETKRPLECHIAKDQYAGANILGIKELFFLKASIERISEKAGTFHLVDAD